MGHFGSYMMDFRANSQLKQVRSLNRPATILLLLFTVAACSGGEDAGQVSKEAELTKQPERVQLADQIAKKSPVDSVAEEKVIELENQASDDEVAESDYEAAADGFDEYAYAEQNEGSTVRLLERSEGYVEWQAPSNIAYKKADIVIVGPNGEQVNYSFSANEAMVLDSSLPDGLYQWESVVTPEIDPYVMDQMRSARESGDLQAQKEIEQRLRDEGSLPDGFGSKDNRQSGAFVVRDGMVTPTSSVSNGEDEDI